MALLPPPAEQQPLGAGWMALALVTAAFLGAAMGLIWDSAGFGETDAAPLAQAAGDD